MGKVIEFPRVGIEAQDEINAPHQAHTPLLTLFELLSRDERIRTSGVDLRILHAEGLIAVSKRDRFKGVWIVGNGKCDWVPAGYLLPSASFSTPLEAAEHLFRLIDLPLSAQVF